MNKIIATILGLAFSFGLILIEQSNFVEQRTPLANFLSVLAYSILGTSILFGAYKFIDWLIAADIEQEIFVEKNVAAAVFKGFFLLGIAVIIGMVIVSP